MNDNDEIITVIDDVRPSAGGLRQPAWRILVVDDDPEVHVATDFALQHVEIFGRRLELAHTDSAAQARALLENDRDFAVILLDVVMETEDAGLQMISFIREDCGMNQTRIILRTGQPGYAPELTVFNTYDINDYRTKGELTRTRLITAISAAIRSYHQIYTIAENKRGLELIIETSTDLIDAREIDLFANHALSSINSLLRRTTSALLCTRHGVGDDGELEEVFVIGASGEFSHLLYRPIEAIDDTRISTAVSACLKSGQHIFDPLHSVLCLNSGRHEGAIYLRSEQALSEAERQLLEVFAANVSASLGSVQLFEQLNFIAYHDALTKLRNRNRFILDLNDISAQNSDIVVALVDLQHFADLNDGLGHETGNGLLVAVAQRLEDRLGNHCLLARIGADVFGVIGPEHYVNPGNLFNIFATPFRVSEHALPASIAIGLCRMLEDKPSGITLLKRANIALNRAKHDMSASHAYFMSEMEDNTRWRLEIIHRLREDFAHHRLTIWYQPQIDLASGQLTGIEALLRWPQADGGFIQPPAVFVPLAEYSGLIVEIGEWILERSCAAFAELRRLRGAPQRVAVNVSMAQFRQQSLAQTIMGVMQRFDIGPGELELEITESIAMDEPKIVVGTLLAIKTTGARIAIDDFGTGFSSLAHLRQLPIDAIKIDRSFIAEIANGKGGMFAETITALGDKLGVTTIAEGVETTEQAGFLRGLGCTTAQGFLYAKPMPLEELKTWIAKRNLST